MENYNEDTNGFQDEQPMTKRTKHMKQIRAILIILLVIALCAVFKVTGKVSITIVLSIFLFLMVLPLVTSLEKLKCPSILATIIAVLVIVIVVVAAVWFVFFTVDALIKTLPSYSSRLTELDTMLTNFARKWFDIPEGFSLISVVNIDWIGSVIMPTLRSVSSSAISILSNTLITILLTVFLLAERSTIIPKLMLLAGRAKEDTVQNAWNRVNKQVSKYITLKVFISVITGACFYGISKAVKLDFAFLWGVLAVILNFIPTIGSIIITILTVLMAILQYMPNWTPILIVAIGTLVIQNVLGNIVEPKLQGNQLNLSPFVIMVALSVFGYIWGIVGMFLAVPLLSIIQILLSSIDETKPIAFLISSGHSFRTEMKRRNERRKQKKGEEYKGDFIMPENTSI